MSEEAAAQRLGLRFLHDEEEFARTDVPFYVHQQERWNIRPCLHCFRWTSDLLARFPGNWLAGVKLDILESVSGHFVIPCHRCRERVRRDHWRVTTFERRYPTLEEWCDLAWGFTGEELTGEPQSADEEIPLLGSCCRCGRAGDCLRECKSCEEVRKVFMTRSGRLIDPRLIAGICGYRGQDIYSPDGDDNDGLFPITFEPLSVEQLRDDYPHVKLNEREKQIITRLVYDLEDDHWRFTGWSGLAINHPVDRSVDDWYDEIHGEDQWSAASEIGEEAEVEN
jgi:hypothetical protein